MLLGSPKSLIALNKPERSLNARSEAVSGGCDLNPHKQVWCWSYGLRTHPSRSGHTSRPSKEARDLWHAQKQWGRVSRSYSAALNL